MKKKHCYRYLSPKMDRCIKKVQRELRDKRRTRVTYILASEELARRLLK